MAALRVLIVDDSPLVREMLTDILESDPGISVAGTAGDGVQAVALTRSLKPDLVAMDVTMPIMDGLEAIEKIMSTTPVPILVITDLDQSKIAFSALSKGALDVYQKSFSSPGMAVDLVARVKSLSRIKVIRHIQPRAMEGRLGAAPAETGKVPPTPPTSAAPNKNRPTPLAVAIASSTGGPRALAQIFSEMAEGFPVPILVAQHMNAGFVNGLVEWLNSVSPITVKFAAEGEILKESHAYFAPASTHITVNARRRINLVASNPGDLLHPSCNLLLSSVAKAFGPQGAGVILTGMGDDGVEGMRSIHEQGGFTLAQDEASSVVFGMPRMAIEKGLIDRVSPLGEIGGVLKQLLGRN